jgi:hypothetical protein
MIHALREQADTAGGAIMRNKKLKWFLIKDLLTVMSRVKIAKRAVKQRAIARKGFQLHGPG